MLKNSKFVSNWIFKVIIWYMSCRFFFVLVCFLFILELKTIEGWIFQRFHKCIWTIGGHKLDTFSVWVHNSLKVLDNSLALKFDNFFEFKTSLMITPQAPRVMITLCIGKSICYSPLICKMYLADISIHSMNYRFSMIKE